MANTRDTLFYDVVADRTSIVFSHDKKIVGYDGIGGWGSVTIPSAGVVPTIAGHNLGGAGELSKSRRGSVLMTQWARQADIDSRTVGNAAILDDVDGVELWGPQPDDSAPGDADKFSPEYDYGSGWSLLNDNGAGYLSHSAVVAAVVAKLGPLPLPQDIYGGAAGMDPSRFIDLDASMVSDVQGSSRSFDDCDFFCDIPNVDDQEGVNLLQKALGFHDSVIFSIAQVPLAHGGYYATGSELFVLQGDGSVDFLTQGGQQWDSAFAEQQFAVSGDVGGQFVEYAVLDLNALEGIGNLTLPVRLPGDVNDDGFVNLLDLDILGANFGSFGVGASGGDINDDGVVDLLDLDLLGANFGVSVGDFGGTPFAAAVPEPAGALLVAMAAACTATRRRQG